MTLEVPIIAARATDGHEGQLLFLWVRLPEDEIEIDFLYRDDLDDESFEEDEGDDLDPSM
jgi:hypothetical protein